MVDPHGQRVRSLTPAATQQEAASPPAERYILPPPPRSPFVGNTETVNGRLRFTPDYTQWSEAQPRTANEGWVAKGSQEGNVRRLRKELSSMPIDRETGRPVSPAYAAEQRRQEVNRLYGMSPEEKRAAQEHYESQNAAIAARKAEANAKREAELSNFIAANPKLDGLSAAAHGWLLDNQRDIVRGRSPKIPESVALELAERYADPGEMRNITFALKAHESPLFWPASHRHQGRPWEPGDPQFFQIPSDVRARLLADFAGVQT